MRKRFFEILYHLISKNKKILAVSCDLGYGGFDKIRKDYPENFINTGAGEQAALDMAIGLTYGGIIPVVYSITPFILYRPFETIRTYINHEKIPVKLIGSGRGNDYEHDGYSHYATDDSMVMDLFPNISSYWPKSIKELEDNLPDWILNREPVYINLTKKI